MQKLIDRGHEVAETIFRKTSSQEIMKISIKVTFATSYILTKNPGVINVEVKPKHLNSSKILFAAIDSSCRQVGAGIRNWAEETSSAHLFSGKVFTKIIIQSHDP